MLTSRKWLSTGFAIGIVLMVCLRLLWLDSDAYPRLSWSSALLTDEGFYIHNARNVILFGRARTDEFNNMLIMPLLHLAQVGVFTVLGVGVVQARLLSVASSLLALWLFYAVVLRLAGVTAARIGTLLLGLEHSFLLYNRLALMDSPALLPMMACLYAFVRASAIAADREREVTASAETGETGPHRDDSGMAGAVKRHQPARANREGAWLAFCGLLFIAAYGVRGLAALMIPAPFVAWWFCYPHQRRGLAFLASGLLAGGVVYLGLWYGPHHRELT